MNSIKTLLIIIIFGYGNIQAADHQTKKKTNKANLHKKTTFTYPCKRYLKGIHGTGNFGNYIPKRKANGPFGGSYHLAEDIWLPGGTEVYSIADGVVVYSDFSQSWVDKKGRKHWNLGNVIVIEHELIQHKKKFTNLCSVYVHLGKNRKVKVGDTVKKGQLIGQIGRNNSDENGLYPAHLHLGIHKGPYFQLSPAEERAFKKRAKIRGLFVEKKKGVVKGDIKVTLKKNHLIKYEFIHTGEIGHEYLLKGGTSPNYKSALMASWVQGYGDKKRIADWLRPSSWIKMNSHKKR